MRMAVRTSRLSMVLSSHRLKVRQGGAGASVPIFGQSKTGGFLRPPASIECRCATFSATVSAAPPQADPSAVSVLRRNTFSVCLSPASRGRQRFRFSSWRTHIRFGVDRQACPAVPAHAIPVRASPRLACPALPRPASPGLACLAYAVRRAFRIAANTLASSLSVAYFLSNARNSARASASICARISLSVNTDTVAR